jgi:branched-chain amino acid aminotransferase
MSTPYPMAYHDGHIVPGRQATLPVGSIALRYGISVFEGIRVYRQETGTLAPWLLDEHVGRLRNSCQVMGLDPNVAATVPTVIDKLLAINEVEHDCYVRVAASAASPGGIDAESRTVLTVSVTPSGRKHWLATGAGMRLTVSRWQRPSPRVFPSEAKNISAYAGPRLALAEAKRAGFDSCLLGTEDGLVSEAPTATLFLVERGRLVTPRLSDAVLPGVTRAWVLAVAPEHGIEAFAEPVTSQRLRAADEVFLCGTGLEFAPVREIDGVTLSGWPSCPVTTRLVDVHFAQARGAQPAVAVGWAGVEHGTRC